MSCARVYTALAGLRADESLCGCVCVDQSRCGLGCRVKPLLRMFWEAICLPPITVAAQPPKMLLCFRRLKVAGIQPYPAGTTILLLAGDFLSAR